MRNTFRFPALAALALLPLGLFAQSVVFNINGKEERWKLNDPFAPAGTKTDSDKAVWNGDGITLTQDGVELTRKPSAITRIEWPGEPASLTTAREMVERGDPARALQFVEPVLLRFDPVRKVPGSLWLKAAEIKLDALSGLSNDSSLASFITLLEANDDGSIPGLAGKIKLARLNRLVRAGDNAAVLPQVETLLGELEDPDMQARLNLIKGDVLLSQRHYEDALNTYLRVPVFFGSQKAFIPIAYLGAAKALRDLDVPATHAQERTDLASRFYLREVIRDYPLSKEAAIAKALLPPEERAAAEKGPQEAVTGKKTDDTGDKPTGQDGEKTAAQ